MEFHVRSGGSFRPRSLSEKSRNVHLNRADAWAVPFVMKRVKFGFRGIEGDKPSIIPLKSPHFDKPVMGLKKLSDMTLVRVFINN